MFILKYKGRVHCQMFLFQTIFLHHFLPPWWTEDLHLLPTYHKKEIITFILYVYLVKCKDWSREMPHWVKCPKIKLVILCETICFQRNCSHQEEYGLEARLFPIWKHLELFNRQYMAYNFLCLRHWSETRLHWPSPVCLAIHV